MKEHVEKLQKFLGDNNMKLEPVTMLNTKSRFKANIVRAVLKMLRIKLVPDIKITLVQEAEAPKKTVRNIKK